MGILRYLRQKPIRIVSPKYKSDAVAMAPPPTLPFSAVGGPMNDAAVTSVKATMI
jgi:hypothetical protein